MCTHLVRGVACGFHADSPTDDNPCPDAWCDRCEEALQESGGEWTEESEAVANIAALCTGCYAAARARNLDVPAHARGNALAMTEAEVDALLGHATEQAQDRQDASDKQWGWGQLGRWHYDPDTRTLQFSDPAKPSLVADVVLVGSFSTKTNTFQWAWQTLDDCDEMERVRTFGEVRGIAMLTSPTWSADEADGWAMTSLAAYLLGADTLYRAPFDHLRWFMLLRNWRRVDAR